MCFKNLSMLEKQGILNCDKMSYANTICVCQCWTRKRRFKLTIAGYYSNKSTEQHVFLNWIQLRLRERAGLIRWAAWLAPSKLVWSISQRIMNPNILLFWPIGLHIGSDYVVLGELAKRERNKTRQKKRLRMCACKTIQNLDDHTLANLLVTSHYLTALAQTYTPCAYEVTLY